MSSLVPPSSSSKASSHEKSSKHRSGSKCKATASPSRRVKNGAVVSSGKDVTHVVRVTVLGLAGITVDRSKCRYSAKDEDLPASPSKMRAVVAFSRNSMIRGTTTLSKPLTRSPNDDVVVTTTEAEEVEVPPPADSGEVLAKSVETNGDKLSPATHDSGTEGALIAGGDDEATLETKSTKSSVVPPPRRHLAVWASEEGKIGSSVTFEANLHRSDMGGTRKSTGASSTYAPKSYDLTIGLTEASDNDQAALALPLGVATLAVSGDESSRGENVTVDLPVWTLSQTRPLDTSDGTGGYPVITLAPASETTSDGLTLKKKRTGFQRLFSKKDKYGNITFPSSTERDAFAAAYSMDSAGDAILRVSVEVKEKDSTVGASTVATGHAVKDIKLRRKVANRPGSPVARKGQVADSFDDDTYDSDEETELTDETDFTDEYTEFTGSLVTAEDETITFTADDDTITLDDSMVTNEDNRIVFFSWINRPGQPYEDDSRHRGNRTGRRSSRVSLLQQTQGQVSLNVLGRQVRLPTCDRSNATDSREDMTHVTADFFGDSYQIPLCRGIAKKDDDDSTTTYTEQNSTSETRIMDFMNGALCQPDAQVKEDIKIVSTFSTLSENTRQVKDSTPQQVFVMRDAKDSVNGGSFFSDEANLPRVPDEPSEVDDIMRIVRSKDPNKSAKTFTAAQKEKEDKVLSDEKKTLVTDGSPKGVDEFVDGDEVTNPRSRILQNISDILQCHYAAGHNIGPRYEPFEPQIPPVIIRSETGVVSVGELTATTHERNIEGASDARLLQRARQMLNESGPPKSKETESSNILPLPLASCGLEGVCSPLVQRDTTSSPIRLRKEDSISIAEANQPLQGEANQTPTEQRAAKTVPNDDECTTFSPIEVVKVSSKEEAASFSRVRSPSAERRAKEKAIQELYSESLPVFASMNEDGSESIVGAFVESKSGDRQMYNPITGQEVDQALI